LVSWQVLTAIGTGDQNNDYYGWDVAISGNANTIAVGAYNADPGGVFRAGLVKLYRRDGTDWNMSQQINGPVGDRFGRSLDLSHDSSTLVVGAWSRSVYIYDYNNVTSLYDLFHATADVDALEVCVSGDGSTVGVTSNSGASIFVRDGNGFQQRGPTFTDYGSEWSGIALSYDGSIVAIGQYRWSSYSGRVGVFQWRDANGNGSMVWVPMGSDITGDANSDELGRYGCVSITHDGLTVSVGAPLYDKDGLSSRGLVRVYNHDSTIDAWNQIGSDLVGDNADDRFAKTALSSDGTYLIVGAYGTGDYAALFEKIENNYEMVGEKVISGEGVSFGRSVDISADGAAVAIGDWGFGNNKGKAYLLDGNDLTRFPSSVPTTSEPSTTHTPSLVPTKEPSPIPSTSPTFAPTAAASKTDFALAFLSDDTIIDFDGTSDDKEITIKTLISNKAPRDSFEQTILVGTDCEFKFEDEYPEDTSLVSISNNVNLDEVDGKMIKVTSEIDIDTTIIASKGVHATDPDNKSIYSEYEEGGEDMAKIEFCIRTDYGKVDVTNSDGSIIESSINFYKVKLTVTFLLQFGFTSASVSIAEAEKSEAEEAGTIAAVLNACDCPAAAASKEDCFGIPVEYDQNDILSVCVYDPAGNSVVTSFKDVTLGNGEISTQVIDSDGKPTSLASVSKLNEEMAMVNTRIISAFFDEASPATVTVSGVAVIGFKTAGTRKLTTVGMEGGKDMRKLQDDNEAPVEGEGAFDVEVLLSDDEQVGAGLSPGFDALEYLTTLVVLAMVHIVLI